MGGNGNFLQSCWVKLNGALSIPAACQLHCSDGMDDTLRLRTCMRGCDRSSSLPCELDHFSSTRQLKNIPLLPPHLTPQRVSCPSIVRPQAQCLPLAQWRRKQAILQLCGRMIGDCIEG
jgi:hypothetical protein